MQNLLARIGVTQAEADARIGETFRLMFEDPVQRFYHELGADMGYMEDTGNHDARTEGMSYGMMVAVQLDRKDIFDRLWLFSKRFMWHPDGKYQGCFAWSTKLDGTRNSQGPAPDGEEYYALALFFAANRWGDGAEPFNYSAQARDILRHCVHQHEMVEGGSPMWDPDNHLIKFVPELPFSDPSYHLPHFYGLFARWADEADRPFWRSAASASRAYLAVACHPETGLAPEYAHFDGTPETTRGHSHYYSDAYRVALNIGLDAAWCGKTPELTRIADNVQRFFCEKADMEDLRTYTVDGQALDQPALHPVAIVATNAAASVAASQKNAAHADQCLRLFWQTPPRTGDRRYYDNFLYLFSLMLLAGRYAVIER